MVVINLYLLAVCKHTMKMFYDSPWRTPICFYLKKYEI